MIDPFVHTTNRLFAMFILCWPHGTSNNKSHYQKYQRLNSCLWLVTQITSATHSVFGGLGWRILWRVQTKQQSLEMNSLTLYFYIYKLQSIWNSFLYQVDCGETGMIFQSVILPAVVFAGMSLAEVNETDFPGDDSAEKLAYYK